MGLGFIEYRDPLVGIIALFSLILLGWGANSLFVSFKTSTRTKRLEKFIENFSLNLSGEDEISQIIKESPDAAKILFVVGEGHLLAGEVEKAVRFFTLILKNVPTKDRELHIRTLCTLSKCFLKLGFIARTKSALIEALRLKSRNKEALMLLLGVYAKTGEFEDALGVSQALEEIGEEYAPYARFFESFRELKSGSDVVAIYQKCKDGFFLREAVRALLSKQGADEVFAFCQNEEIPLVYDILWQISLSEAQKERVKLTPRLEELFAAKGVVDKQSEFENFEFEKAYLFSKMRPTSAVLIFGYRCRACGFEDFDYFAICKKCAKLGLCKVEPKVIKNEMRDFDMSSFS